MSTEPDPREDPERVAAAVAQAAEDLRQRNRALGWPLVVWRAGKVVYLDAATLQPMDWPSGVRDRESVRLPPQS